MTTQQILKEELDILKSDIIIRLQNSKQVASGETIKKFETVSNNSNGQLLGASYVGVFEKGRKPGGVPRDFIEILKRWSQAKGMSFENEDKFNLWANAVKWKMIKEGTKLYRSGQTQDIFTTPIEDFSNRIARRFIVHYEAQIFNEIFNF